MSGHFSEDQIAELLVKLKSSVDRLEKELDRLEKMDDRLREVEIKVERNSVRLTFIVAISSSIGGAFVSLVVRWLGS